MRKRNSPPRISSIGEILFSLLKHRGLAVEIKENAVFKSWAQAVGPQIAHQTKPDSLKNGILFVKTTSSAWAQQLHFLKGDILRKLNDLVGKETIKEIRFSLGHEVCASQNQSDQKNAMPPSILLKDRDKKMIAQCTAKLADRELAEIIKKVMEKEISNRRLRQRQGH